MSLRLATVIVPQESADNILKIFEDAAPLGVWRRNLDNDQVELRALLKTDETESLLDRLGTPCSANGCFRVILQAVEATIPRPEVPEQDSTQVTASDANEPEKSVERLNREELYAKISETTRFSSTYLTLIIVSALVAAVGLMRNNVAVIIGAMVIAPLLGPNAGLALATTLADGPLARQALRTGLIGMLVAIVFSVVIGAVVGIDVTTPMIVERTQVSLSDLVLALASGIAGSLAFTSGASSALVGVMVAVALMPPLVVVGLLLSCREWRLAGGAALLLLANVICVNLAGVITFAAQGIRPATWWEAERAKAASRRAILLWTALLLILVGTILLSHHAN